MSEERARVHKVRTSVHASDLETILLFTGGAETIRLGKFAPVELGEEGQVSNHYVITLTHS
jgi:hypothetical protein